MPETNNELIELISPDNLPAQYLCLFSSSVSAPYPPLYNAPEEFIKIQELLQNPSLCYKYLKDLDSKLGTQLLEANLNLSCYLEIKGFIQGRYLWPVLEEKYRPKIRTRGILSQILLEKEQSYGFNSDELLLKFDIDSKYAPIPHFGGFVPEEIGAEIVRSGGLFRDKYGEEGRSLEINHGTESHRIQWYLLFSYLEELYNNDKEKILAFLTKVRTHLPRHWGNAFDRIGSNFSEGFSSPFAIQSALLVLAESFPALSLYLRKQYWNSLRRLAAAAINIPPNDKELWVIKLAISELGTFRELREFFSLPLYSTYYPPGKIQELDLTFFDKTLCKLSRVEFSSFKVFPDESPLKIEQFAPFLPESLGGESEYFLFANQKKLFLRKKSQYTLTYDEILVSPRHWDNFLKNIKALEAKHGLAQKEIQERRETLSAEQKNQVKAQRITTLTLSADEVHTLITRYALSNATATKYGSHFSVFFKQKRELQNRQEELKRENYVDSGENSDPLLEPPSLT